MNITNNLQRLALATVGSFSSLVVMKAQPVRAATVTYDFTVNVGSSNFGLAGQQYSGFFSFDESQIVRSSTFPSLFITQPTDFNFNFAGTTYTRSDLLFEPGPLEPSILVFPTQTPPLPFPNVNLEVKYGPSTPSDSGCCINIANNLFFVAGGPPPIRNASGTVTYSLRQSTTSVPEPSAVLGLTLLSLNGLLLKKKVKSFR